MGFFGFFQIFLMILSFLSITQKWVCVASSSSCSACSSSIDDGAEKFEVHGLQKLPSMEENDGFGEEDGNQGLIVQKFTSLIRLKSWKTLKNEFMGLQEKLTSLLGFKRWNNPKREAFFARKFRFLLGDMRLKEPKNDYSPSPSSIFEPETQAPSPLMNFYPPSHSSSPISNHDPPQNMIQKKKSRAKGIFLVPVFVSAGAAAGAAIVVAGVLGLMCACGKKNNSGKSKTRWVKNKTSKKKLKLNPKLDLSYLNSLGVDLEQQQEEQQKKQSCCVGVESNDSGKTLSDYFCSVEMKKPESKSETENAGSSSYIREIIVMSSVVHDHDEESVLVNESDCRDNLTKNLHSFDLSENESFHSFCDSNSSSFRLSNASVCSDKPEFLPNKFLLSPLPCSASFPISSPSDPSPNTSSKPETKRKGEEEEEEKKMIMSCNSVKNYSPPPPPPPPPPKALSRNMQSFHAETCLPSSRKSCSDSGSNGFPKNYDLPASPRKQSSESSIPPPPCPPPSETARLLGSDGATLTRLKPLHWDKVRAQPDCTMVWDKLRSSSFELDEEMIESLFGYNLHSSMKNDEAKSDILDPKRLQNITILSKALNVTADQVCDAVTRGDGLCLQQLEALAKMVLTNEEESKLWKYNGDISELDSAERFVKTILSVPFAFLRVEAMLYRETFEDEVVHLRNSFSMLEEACVELRSSRLFLKLLEAVLKTGNRMNVGTIRGGARAFKLDALLKLADVKGTDGKTTLLHFVVQEIVRSEGIRVSDNITAKRNKTLTVEEKEEEYKRTGLDLVSGLTTELHNVKKTATIDLDVLASSVSNLSDGKAKLHRLVHENLSTATESVKFVHSMTSFLRYAEKSIKELREDEGRVLLLVREISEYFHGNVSKDEVNPLRIFVIVRDFLGMLDHVCKELRSLKILSSPCILAPFKHGVH